MLVDAVRFRPDGQELQQLLMLGEQHAAFGRHESQALADGRTAAAISVGGDYVRQWKGGLAVPNEDCAFACEHGGRTLLVVGDGHGGHRASHALLRGFAAAAAESGVPASADELVQLGAAAGRVAAVGETAREAGATTLLAVVVDRPTQRLFGLCSGDSSAIVLPAAGAALHCVDAGDDYVSLASGDATADGACSARPFEAPLCDGDFVLLHSDGINECRRGRPAESILLHHLEQLRLQHDEPLSFVDALVQLALRGTGQHGGGEDNVVAVATRV